MKTTKGGKVMNPTDAYRKELRKKELKRNKKERKKVREVGILKKNPNVLKEQIDKLELMKADGALDKARKHKKRQLEDTLHLVMKKRKEYEDKMKEKGETPVMFSHLGLPRRRTSTEEEERVNNPKPEDSVYYHPTLNPTGAPPPGKPPMYKSSIGPRIPLSTAASSSNDLEDGALEVPPPPPPPPLPESSNLDSGENSSVPASLPLPPPPPLPPTPASALGVSVPLPPLPPPPPGPPPKDQVAGRTSVPPPPPPLQQSSQPPPGTIETERDRNSSVLSDEPAGKETSQVHTMLPPPPPPGMALGSTSNHSEGSSPEANVNNPTVSKDNPTILPPPPPPRQQPPVPAVNLIPTLQSDVLPPGVRLPPPLMMGPPGQVMVPLMPRPPYGPPPMMRPPLPPGPPPTFHEDAPMRPFVPQKPSYVKSAASTVVKRPLAQHTPELTAMVPASVRVRRETAVSKPKPKQANSSVVPVAAAVPAVHTVVKREAARLSSAPKGKSIDDSYMAFLEDMKALGALDS